MKPSASVKSGLDKKFQKVLNTPASFAFYLAIHDFIKHIEDNAALSGRLLSKTKLNRELNIVTKYGYLKQIYQTVEDTNRKSDADMGHTRCMALLELNKIRSQDVSESNTFWKKREVFRKLTSEVYAGLNATSV